MRAQTYLKVLSVHRLMRSPRDKLVVVTHVNKGKTYPYGSKRQNYK